MTDTNDGGTTRPPLLRLWEDEAIADNFAGGGGASTGIELAIGRSPDVAVNHDPEAIAMHTANHPGTRHYIESVWDVDPVEATGGRRVALAWFSPDCKHFSRAKGGKPREQKVRGLAWVATSWAARVKPRVIILENVEEFLTWGPLHRTGTDAGRPIKARAGETFRAFVRRLQLLGYAVEWRVLRAHDYGAPTSRKRFFLIARRDGHPIVWPAPTHGPGRAAPHRSAGEVIDWAIPTRSIFGRAKPLARPTMARLARGAWEFVLTAARPFVVTLRGGEASHVGASSSAIEDPLRAISAGGTHHGVAVPYVVPYNRAAVPRGAGDQVPTLTTHDRVATASAYLVPVNHGGVGRDDRRVHSADDPIRTITGQCRGEHALAAAYLVHLSNGERAGQAPRIYDTARPMNTIPAGGVKQGACVAKLAHLVRHFGDRPTGGWAGGSDLHRPIHTVTARDHHALATYDLAESLTPDQLAGARRVAAFLRAHGYDVGEVATLELEGRGYAVVDLGMRMLTPRELFRAQGFPDSYVIDLPGPRGKPLSKTAQVRMCGNSVCPPLAAALAGAQFSEAA